MQNAKFKMQNFGAKPIIMLIAGPYNLTLRIEYHSITLFHRNQEEGAIRIFFSCRVVNDR